MTEEIYLALAIASAAGLMRGFAGVGSGMLMALFFVYIFGPIATVGIIIMIELVATAQLLPSVWRKIDWKVIGPMGLAAAVVMPFGRWLLVSLDAILIQTGVALLVTISALTLMTGWRYVGVKPLPITISVGNISGLLMSITSLGNPPVMLYLLSSQDDAGTNRANFTGYFAVTLMALLSVMIFSGLITIHTTTTAAVLLPGFLLATWIGSRLFSKSNEKIYKMVALVILLLAGIYGLAR
jgi:uncharacterized membrane protein YfcA